MYSASYSYLASESSNVSSPGAEDEEGGESGDLKERKFSGVASAAWPGPFMLITICIEYWNHFLPLMLGRFRL